VFGGKKVQPMNEFLLPYQQQVKCAPHWLLVENKAGCDVAQDADDGHNSLL
jgi:hypothetical protein